MPFFKNTPGRFRRVILLFLCLMMAGFVALNILAYRQARSMMYFTTGTERTPEAERLSFVQKIKVLWNEVSIPRPTTSVDISQLGMGSRGVTIAVTNGITLGAWYCPGANTNQLVILFHGYCGEKSGTLPMAQAFLKMGMSVLLVDFRGSGESSAAYTTVGYDEGEDVAAAVRYARANLHPDKMILYGISMGAAAVLRAVHDCGARVDGIIVESVFDSMMHAVSNRMDAMNMPSFPCAELLIFWGGWQAGFNGFRNNPVDYATAVNVPILFFHGTRDERARLEQAHRVFDAVPGKKKWFVEFTNVNHESGLRLFQKKWTEAVQKFLDQI